MPFDRFHSGELPSSVFEMILYTGAKFLVKVCSVLSEKHREGSKCGKIARNRELRIEASMSVRQQHICRHLLCDLS